MSLPASDLFSTGTSLGAGWVEVAEVWTVNAGTGVCQTGGSASYGFAKWTGDSFGANHYAEVACLTDGGGGGSYYGPAVNLSGTNLSNLTGYSMYCRHDSADVRRWDGTGSPTTIATLGTQPTNGQVVRLKNLDNSTLQVFYDGVQIGSDISDGTYRNGTAGMTIYVGATITSWAADDVAGGGGGGSAPSKRLGVLGVG